MTTDEHPLIAAVRPLVDRIGGVIIPPGHADTADVQLVWDGVVVAAVRIMALDGALDRIVSGIEQEMGRPLDRLDRTAKQAAVRILDERGAFLLRKSIEDVADLMGVSRITIYNYLNAIRDPID